MRWVSGRRHERLVPKLGNLTGLSPPRLGVSPPGLPASRSAPTSCARPARLPPVPWSGSQAPVRAATREQGRDGRHDQEGGGGRGAEREAGARTAGPRARHPRRVLSRLGRPLCGRLAPTRCSPAPAPPQPRPSPIRLALCVIPSLLRASLIGRRGSGGLLGTPRGGASSSLRD